MMFNLSRNIYFIRHQHILVQNKVNVCTKLWLANRANQNIALAGPTAVWVASGHREARPLVTIYVLTHDRLCATLIDFPIINVCDRMRLFLIYDEDQAQCNFLGDRR